MTGNRLLSVDADLVINIGDQQVFIRGTGSQIVVELPSFEIAVKLVQNLAFRSAHTRLTAISAALTTAGLTVIVRTPGRRLMTIGQDGHWWLFRLFGFPNARFHAF